MGNFMITGTLKGLKKQISNSGYSKTSAFLISRDSSRNKYQKYFITFWRNEADEILKTCCIGDCLRITGVINFNDRTRKYELIGHKFEKIQWNDDDKRFLPVSVCT